MLTFLAGIGGGWAFFLLWRTFLPRTRSRVFWQAIPVHANGMLHCADPDDVIRHYGALMKHAASFAGRNAFAVFAGLAPVIAMFLLADETYSHERRAALVEMRPAIAPAYVPASLPTLRSREGGLLIDRRGITEAVHLFGEPLSSEDLATKQAFCSGPLACAGFQLMLFDTHRVRGSPSGWTGRTVVLRPQVFAGNPLWPYLDNLELAFLVGVILGSLAAAWRSKRAAGPPT